MHTVRSESSTVPVATKWWSPVDLTPVLRLGHGNRHVSVALRLCGYPAASEVLLAIAVVAYMVLSSRSISGASLPILLL